MASSESGSTGIGFIGILQIVFIVLKLCKIINWSWFFVLLPIMVNIVLFIIIIICAIIYKSIGDSNGKRIR